ncbi:putative RNA processing protein Grc3 [Aspergillus candidus]|uniref:Polynucleotide 5'-hydroxyl-kinase GRC3 n=1 Tax=Aspergillus candidus TaxID=41067 RepID=A0A2I2F4T8_ASPCN|nr:hypothetical protein BDW47DRAFT_127886 [Aspergillus candidus]PLB35662.1 hypothetical protein BDW47DRAFT_127886 [Aspergillus candidus]
MVKRKAEKQQAAAPLSAVAARKARQQQAQAQALAAEKPSQVDSIPEPPSKKPRHEPESQEQETPAKSPRNDNPPLRRSSRRSDAIDRRESVERKETKKVEVAQESLDRQIQKEIEDQVPSDSDMSEPEAVEEDTRMDPIAAPDEESEEEAGYESPAEFPVQVQEFPLSKTRLNKSNVVYSDEETLCVRIKEKMSLVLVGQYDLWVKRGLVSLMGAKLHPSPQVYRVYAPSTHSLPVIKCVAGVDGVAEVEIKSCSTGITRLGDLSPLYQCVWNGKKTPADKFTLKQAPSSCRRSFSVLNTSADDSLKRHLRPLHLEKQWSAAIKSLSQRGGRLRTLVCGPKGSGKSTFSRYLLNHLLSPAPQTETNYCNTDGVAFLDLDPGQPEFSPMGQVSLTHVRAPVFGPPFTHPSLDGSRQGTIVRAHHIGATSPREDPDHYMLSAVDLMDRYHALLASYPQCPLIINYPGWIFGLGLEVATWLIRTLGLSDVVYMSEKGPGEVVEPLAQAAHHAAIRLTTLPSQPTDFVSRSSAQLRAMQMQSYFHMDRPDPLATPLWSATPLARTRPFRVRYAGPTPGIRGIMVLGSAIQPDILHEVLDGSIVSIVALESPTPILGHSSSTSSSDPDSESPATPLDTLITRAPTTNLPYLFSGSGSTNPPDPKTTRSLGLALIRSINPNTQHLELITPIPPRQIQAALTDGESHGIILVRGTLDNPNWALSEEYHSARAAQKRHRDQTSDNQASKPSSQEQEKEDQTSALLNHRIRQASNVPWMKVIEDHSRWRREQQQRGSAHLWKLKKKAYPGSESEGEW